MRDLRRTNLYSIEFHQRYVRCVGKIIGYKNLYYLLLLAKISKTTLAGIEELFLMDEKNNQEGGQKSSAGLIDQLNTNIEILRQNDFLQMDTYSKLSLDDKEFKEFLIAFERYLIDIENMKAEDQKDDRQFFYSLLWKKLIPFTEKILANRDYASISRRCCTIIDCRENNQVFLSYAYDDHLYTIFLFLYFLKNNIFLFVDWMWNEPCDDAQKLKSYLNKALNGSSQLLFLRSITSELGISNPQVRQWCAWEIGNFFSLQSKLIDGELNKNEKYYIELYRGLQEKNLFLQNLRPLRRIDKKTGRIV